MKHAIVILLGAAMCSSFVHAGQPISLAQAITTARSGSPDALTAEARVSYFVASADGAASSLRPQIGLSGSYMQTNSPLNAFGAILNTGTFDNTIDFNDPGQVDVLTLGVYIRQLVYDGGRTRNSVRAARSLAQSVQAERDAALATLDLAVVRAFYEVVEADESVAALRSALASYEESLRVAVLREDSGLMLRSERLNIEVQLSRTQAQLIAAQGRADIARSRFASVLGLPAGSDMQPDPAAGLVGTQDILSGSASPDWPELAAMDARVQAAELALRSAKGGRMPQVGAFASAQRDEGWRRDGNGESWTAGVAVSMNLFDGDRTGAAIREAGAALEIATEMRRSVELALNLRLNQARVDHDVARRQLEVCRRQLEQADESARLSRERFAAGSLLSAELIGVETRLAEARVQLAVSEARERVALAALRHALGINIL